MPQSVPPAGESADAGQETDGNGTLPHGFRVKIGQTEPVTLHTAALEAFRRHFFQDKGVPGLIRPVAQHGAHFIGAAAVILISVLLSLRLPVLGRRLAKVFLKQLAEMVCIVITHA